MYTPKHFQMPDVREAVSFMQRYSFATMVNTLDGVPVATHIPFIVEQRDGTIVLLSHFAKANPQAAASFNGTSLVIFSEPHAYISPSNYEKVQNVPTWNYISVHAYGRAKLISDVADIEVLLKKMIGFYEQGYMQQWDNLEDDYKLKMMKGIVAFEIVVDDLQAKKKLSQNRTEAEQQNIIETFSKSGDANERQIGKYMSGKG
ncbi:FMN-binding negative transcriptional regulator [Mucilaginibacter terrenus]|uniref:FMN-binding negative transcriptional regulator n=1 Tax=Mucilaginibacter terrenus TaxID=2482727 RepID=A0A3E2NUH2_9SPHI|nr:FMN-binding negative transcriptional regulator [Mucilaginibacter terrenus]RFZ84648.1 FMN-binding negative transcriptional regulator [Mucilaginibacter terrenus]